MPTQADFVSITNSASADAESAASSISVTPGATITEITIQDLTVGHTYAVNITFPGVQTPQKYLATSNGAAATNGGKIIPGIARIPVRISVPKGLSNVNVTTFADTASATCQIGLKWDLGQGNQQTFGDFTITTQAGTSETKVGTINVPGGGKLKQITYASRLGVGLLKSIRLDFSGVTAPQKYTTSPTIYDATGTEVQNASIFAALPIDVDITLPNNTASIDVYAISQTASNTVAIGLVWV